MPLRLIYLTEKSIFNHYALSPLAMLRSIAILASLLLAISAEPTILQSPRVTNWGEWTGKRCPSGQFVRGLRVKYDNAQYFSDQTGINAIELVCHNRSDQVDTYLKSGEGPHGDWLELQYCPEGEYGVGFAIRSAGPLRGRFDDYGVVNFQLYCGQPNGKRNSWHRLTGKII